MAAYAKRHYGIDSYRLRDPKVIVEHYTVTSTFQQTWNTFAPDNPDSELKELPGTCAHYVIDKRRDDLPARPALDHVPAHGRAQLHGDRDRARRLQRRAGARQRQADGRLAAAHALAALPLRDRRQQRDRPRREPQLAVSPRARRAAQERRRTATWRAPRCGPTGRSWRRRAHAEYVGQMRIVASASLILALVAVDTADAATKAKPRLKAFSSCKSLVELRARRRASARTAASASSAARLPGAPVTITTPPIAPVPTDTRHHGRRRRPADGRSRSRPRRTSGGGASRTSPGTNTQEADVDEPDVIKTDGRRIFAVTDAHAAGDRPGDRRRDRHARARRQRAPPAAARRPRAGDRQQGRLAHRDPVGRPIAPTVAPLASTTIVTEIDVSAAPKVMRTMEVPGRFVDARQNGAVARLVIDSVPQPIAGAHQRQATA